jgi:hypothetical protein
MPLHAHTRTRTHATHSESLVQSGGGEAEGGTEQEVRLTIGLQNFAIVEGPALCSRTGTGAGARGCVRHKPFSLCQCDGRSRRRGGSRTRVRTRRQCGSHSHGTRILALCQVCDRLTVRCDAREFGGGIGQIGRERVGRSDGHGNRSDRQTRPKSDIKLQTRRIAQNHTIALTNALLDAQATAHGHRGRRRDRSAEHSRARRG